MWVEQTKKGFRLVERVEVDGKMCKVSVPMLRNTAQAKRKAQDELLDKISRKRSHASEKPISELIEAYIPQRHLKPSSEIVLRGQFRNILNIIGDMPACAMSAPKIKQTLLETGKKPKTLNRYLENFRTFIRWCYEFGYISEDFSGRLRSFITKTEKPKSESLYLEDYELAHVLEQLHGMNFHIVKFLALTGCRFGEMAALTVDDIDEKYVHITKSFSSGMLSTPKSQASERNIFIQPELREMLTTYMEWRRVYMMSKGIRTNLLFFTVRGEYASNASLCCTLRRLDCAKHLHPHIFRHTHTALLAEQGMSLEAISRRLGHESSDVTKEVYMHVTEKMKLREEEQMSAVRIF